MILYFSGTGNSLWAARRLAEATHEDLIDICSFYRKDRNGQTAENKSFAVTLKKGERLGFVFPVHAWNPPGLVEDFLKQIQINGYTCDTYCYFLCTCGDDTGYTDKQMRNTLLQKNISLNAAYSLQMPNTYICFPGFDIDDPATQEKKLTAAKRRMNEVIREITEYRHDVNQTNRGTFPFIKSNMIHPLFNRYMVNDHSFRITDSCISCGKCAQICPLQNITLKNGKPNWLGNCTQCLACYHVCPKQAITNGRSSLHKGQYLHPDLTNK